MSKFTARHKSVDFWGQKRPFEVTRPRFFFFFTFSKATPQIRRACQKSAKSVHKWSHNPPPHHQIGEVERPLYQRLSSKVRNIRNIFGDLTCNWIWFVCIRRLFIQHSKRKDVICYQHLCWSRELSKHTVWHNQLFMWEHAYQI